MAIRLSGMMSGLDTDSIISELVKSKSAKKDKLVKSQTKLQWKQDAWKDLNKKVYSFYSKSLSNMRFSSDMMKKTTKVSSSAATVITGGNAVNGVQTLKINQLAKSGYLTGAQLRNLDGTKANYTDSTKLVDLGVEEGSEFTLTANGKTTAISVDANTTIGQLTSKLKDAGINASFDTKNQRFFLSAKESGKSGDFSFQALNASGNKALSALGINVAATNGSQAQKYYQDIVNKVYDENGDARSDDQIYQAFEQDILGKVEGKKKELDSLYASQKSAIEKNQKSQEALEDKYKDDNTDFAKTIDELKEAIEAEKAKKDTDDYDGDLVKKLENTLKDKEKYISLQDEATSLNEKQTELLSKYTPAVVEDDGTVSAESRLQADYEQSLKDTAVSGYKGLAAEAKLALEAGKALENMSTEELANTNQPTRIYGQDAQIMLNGALFEASGNTFEINGLTITANAETAEEITLTTAEDTDGIYDMIKNFLKEYNELINEMDKLYNAESTKGYEPLTDEEKDALSDKEVEKWEEKIKDSILRRDSTLGTVSNAMKEIMLSGVKMKDGSQMFLSNFGVNTLGYFVAGENEKNAYHIDGDPDDTSTSTNADKLKTAIANNSAQVVEFFTSLSKNLYTKVGDLMKGTEYSSSFTLYDDKSMKTEYNDYTNKIAEQEKRVTDFEDRYYKKFSKMETAMAKMQSKQTALSGFFGGSM